jgi:hypothetical protein
MNSITYSRGGGIGHRNIQDVLELRKIIHARN